MKNIKNLLKAVIVISIAFALTIPVAAQSNIKTKSFRNSTVTTTTEPAHTPRIINDAIFEDGFESYENFVLDFPPWTQFDGDGGETWGSASYNFTNEYYVGSFIIFNSSATDPPANGTVWDAHTGDKYAACFSARPPNNPNDDWLITPELNIGEETAYVAIHCVSDDAFAFQLDDFSISETRNSIEISFWAKSITDQYGLEKFQVGVSTTDNSISSFEIITPDPYVEAPTTWTEYTYTYDLAKPELEIGEIKGGIGIRTVIKNNGTADATNVSWFIGFKGGLVIPNEKADIIPTLKAGEEKTINFIVIGFGKSEIGVWVDCNEESSDEKHAIGVVILIFVLGVG